MFDTVTWHLLNFTLTYSLYLSSSQLTHVLYMLKQWLLKAWHTQTHQFKSTYKISLQSNGPSCHVNAAILGHFSVHNIPKGKILCIYTLMVSHLSQKGVICNIHYFVCSSVVYVFFYYWVTLIEWNWISDHIQIFVHFRH